MQLRVSISLFSVLYLANFFTSIGIKSLSQRTSHNTELRQDSQNNFSILHILLSNFANKTMSKLFSTKCLRIFGNVNLNFVTEYSYINNSRKEKLWNRQPVGVGRVALTWQVETFSLIEGNKCMKAPKLVKFMACEIKIVTNNVNKFQHFG